MLKKVSQTTPVSAQIVDGYSTSTTDGYSANYINNKINNNDIEIPIYLPDHTYTQDDVDRVIQICIKKITPTEEDYKLYDLTFDGIITPADSTAIQNIINGSIVIPEDRVIGKIKIKNEECYSGITVENYLTKKIIKFNLGSIYMKDNNNKEISIQSSRGGIEIQSGDYYTHVSDRNIKVNLRSSSDKVEIGNVSVNGSDIFGIVIQGSNKTTTITENGVTTTNN